MHKDVDLMLFKDELNLDLMIGYKDSQDIVTVNRNLNFGLLSNEISDIKCKVLKKSVITDFYFMSNPPNILTASI